MQNPEAVSQINRWIMKATSLFGSNYQPSSGEVYTNPGYKHFGFLYGNHLLQFTDTPISYHFQYYGGGATTSSNSII